MNRKTVVEKAVSNFKTHSATLYFRLVNNEQVCFNEIRFDEMKRERETAHR